MLTLGVDLAASDKRTAVCEIHWADGKGEIRHVHAGVTDERLLDAFERADKVGIDAPFGWPEAFVESIAAHRAHQEGNPWPGHAVERLRLRETDRDIQQHTGLWPLSVSSTLIGVVAMRCAQLVSLYEEQHGPVPRDGSGRLVEVYPAAALKRWGFPCRGYKRKENRDARCRLLEAIRTRTQNWLTLPDAICQTCEDSDDALDAVIAALVARAAATRRCELILDDDREPASREGWIALPRANSFDVLAAGEPLAVL